MQTCNIVANFFVMLAYMLIFGFLSVTITTTIDMVSGDYFHPMYRSADSSLMFGSMVGIMVWWFRLKLKGEV